MKRVTLGIVISCTAVMCSWAGTHGHDRHHYSVVQGPKGEPGVPGKNGAPGHDGRDGAAGRDGLDGKNGEDGLDATRANVGAEIEWHEWKRASLASGYRYDTLHHGHTVDMAILKIRVGPSYAEREIGALNAKIERLSTMLEGQNQGKVREITIRGAK